MSYQNDAITRLAKAIKEHTGYGTSKEFQSLKKEIIFKLGKKHWERILSKAKRKSIELH